MKIDVTVQGDVETMARLQQAADWAVNVVNEQTEMAAINIQRYAKQNLANHVNTGRLRSSIYIRAPITGGPGGGIISREVVSDVDYGPHIEYGTAPHDIYPRTKKALAWPVGRRGLVMTAIGSQYIGEMEYRRAGKTGGAVDRTKGGKGITRNASRAAYDMVRKHVHHPGTKATPFMRPAAEAEMPRYFSRMRNALQRGFK